MVLSARLTASGGPYGFSFASSFTISSGFRPNLADKTSKGSIGVYAARSRKCGLTKLSAEGTTMLVGCASLSVTAAITGLRHRRLAGG